MAGVMVLLDEGSVGARRRLRGVLDALAAGVAEDELGVRVAGDREAALMDRPVVAATEQAQVLGVGRTSARPVNDVVGVDPALVGAAGEATAAVALAQGEVNAGEIDLVLRPT